MILVTCIDNGDTAEAPSPESAVLAAKTLADDAAHRFDGLRARVQGSALLTFTFTVDGKVVGRASERDLWAIKV